MTESENNTKKVLVIDSDVESLHSFNNFLSLIPGIELIQTCKSGKTAINFLKFDTADIIIMDPILSDMNGFDIFNQVENIPQVVVFTLSEDQGYYAYQIGALDYQLKPVTLVKLEESMERVLGTIKMNEEYQELKNRYSEENEKS